MLGDVGATTAGTGPTSTSIPACVLSAAGGGEKNVDVRRPKRNGGGGNGTPRRGGAFGSIHLHIRRGGCGQRLVGGRGHRYGVVSGTPAYVRKEGRYVLGSGRDGRGRNKTRASLHPPCQRRTWKPQSPWRQWPVAVSTVASREEEAARITAADAAGILASSAASEGILGKWGAELPPVPVSQ